MIRAYSKWDSMQIVCPSCSAAYEVPASRLRPGKLVRCARCGKDWLPDPEIEDAAVGLDAAEPPVADAVSEGPAPLPDVTAMDRLAASPASRPWRTSLIGAWLVTFIVLAGAVAAVVSWRDTVIRVWPPGGRLLAAIGQASPPPAQIPGKKSE
jgi:predicted Zn finger-like uncharacterized protein